MANVPTIDQVDNPLAHGYDGYIDNVLIRLAVSRETPLQDVTAEATPPRIDTSEVAEDVRDEVGRRYSRTNLSGGAGLDFLHRVDRPADAAKRFWDSKGVDVFDTDKGDIYEACLMHSMEAESIGTDLIDVAQIDGTIYYARAAGIYRLTAGADPLEVAHTGILKLIAMGNSLYTLDATNGVRRYDPPSWSPVSVSTKLYDDIWPAKARMIGVLNNEVFDADADSAPILTFPAADTATSVIESGPAVLVFSTTGSVYSLALNDNLELVPAGQSKFTNERPIMAAETFGVMGILTAETTEAGGIVTRFYTGALELSGSYDLTNLQLIFQVGDRNTTEDLTPHATLATRDSIYVAIPEEGTTEITLWRYYLPTGGYARAHSVDPGQVEVVSSIVEVDDRMFVCLDGDDLYKESDEYVANGYVIGPLADFYTSDQKQWIGAELFGSELVQGTGLELYDTADPELISLPDSTSWQLVTQLNVGEPSSSETALSGRNNRYHVSKVIWRSDSSRMFTPCFQSYSIRALPNPVRDVLYRIPINVSDQIESPRRRAIRVPGRGDAIEAALRAYEGSHVLIELYRPELKVQGLIEQFESTIETITVLGAVRKVMYARIRGTRLVLGHTVVFNTSGASLGQDISGLFRAGVGVDSE